MRRALLATLILAVVGCGGGGSPNALIGEWEIDGPGNCAGLMTFTDADYASATVCPVSATAADVTTTTGSYSISGDTLTLTTQKSTWKSTCSTLNPSEEAQFSTSGDSLMLTVGTVTAVFMRFTSMSQGAGGVVTNSLFASDGTLTLAPGSGFVVTTGCLAFDGTFQPAPLAPL